MLKAFVMVALEAQIENREVRMENSRIKQLPELLKTKVSELENLIIEHPNKIPVTKVAKFLDMDVECLKRGIEQNRVPFAFGCNNDKHGNRYSYISTLKFYLWMMSPIIN